MNALSRRQAENKCHYPNYRRIHLFFQGFHTLEGYVSEGGTCSSESTVFMNSGAGVRRLRITKEGF